MMENIKSVQVLFQSMLIVGIIFSCSAPSKSETKRVTISLNKSADEISSGDQMEPSEEPDIYYLNTIEWEKGTEEIAFVSLSEIYPLSNHPDSLAIPDISDMPYDSIRNFKLTGKYRKQFFRETEISENDNIFIFNYSTGKLLSFPLRKLALVAALNAYTSENDAAFSQEDYMIGFAINKSLLTEIDGEHYNYVLVAVGKKNPFAIQKLELINWKKVAIEEFPRLKSRSTIVSQLKGFRTQETYCFKSPKYDYFIQEFKRKEFDYERSARHVLIINATSGKTELEEVFIESEGCGMAPLNLESKEYPDRNQWTGQLFKGRNPVVFGFTFHSFDCSSIYFIGEPRARIITKCDSRH
jgi:hypothetical protein